MNELNNNTDKIKYFIYARKSSESEDRQMNSIEDQIKILRDLAKRENLEVVEILQESGSAKKPGRKVFNEMMTRIHKGEADGILCWKLNRLSRNSLEGGMVAHTLETGILKEILTPGKSYHPEDNVMMMAVELGMAIQYSKDLARDTKRGLEKKAERGWFPAPAPTGYLKHPDMKKGEKEIITDKERFHLIRKLWDFVLSGNYNPAQAMEKLTNEYGLRNLKGKKYGKNAAYSILRNPFYYGEFEFPKGSGKWYKGKHKAMITKKEFDKVQKMISNHSKTKNETELKDLFPYKGNLKCGSCGQSINAERKRRITCDCKHRFSALKTETCPKCGLHLSEMKSPKIEERIYYACKNKLCPEKTTKEDVIENTVKEWLSELSEFPKDLLELTFSTIDRLENKELSNKEINIKRIEKDIKEKENKLDSLIEMRLSRELDAETFKLKQNEYKKDIEELKEILNNKDNNLIKNSLEEFIKFGEIATKKFENANKIEKKEIFNAISSNQLLKGGKPLLLKDSSYFLILELVKGYKSKNSTLRTSKNPYFTTKKAPFEVLDSSMLHR